MFKKIKELKFEKIIPRLIASWLSISVLNLAVNNKFNSIEYLQNSNMLLILSFFLLIFIIYTFLNKKIKKIDTDSLAMLLSYAICTIIWLNNNQNNFFFLLAIIFFFSLIILYFINKNKTIFKKIEINKKIYLYLLSITILIPAIILTIILCLRYYNFNAPNFDFGIFSNIFYNMKKTLLPVSTCERDILLSHFAVHFSPILYLILPIYFIFSHPITLQIIQVLLLFSGIIPIIKLTKHYNLSKNKILIISFLYCLYPALSCGTFFDFHENIFLTPLLLWVFYFFETNKNIPMYIMTLLTFFIKEDAAIYIAIFALYLIISRKKYLEGSKLLISSILYFLIVTTLLDNFGLGVMSDRFSNLIYNDNGLISALKTIILNPGYVLKQILSLDKLIYVLKLFLPLCFIPLITKKTSRLILILPVLINLISDYIYLYDITFHYNFAVIAFLFYISIQNLSELKENKTILALAFIFTISMYYTLIIPILNNNLYIWKTNKKEYKETKEILKNIPEEASVNASTFFVPHLANRKEIYEVYYHENKTDIDYVILDMRYEDNIDIINYYKNNNYEIILEKKIITILKK